MAAKIDIFNQAVGMVKAKPISDPDENSLEARECRRFYPQVVAEMLEGPHDWSFANRRAVLAQLATNDRDNEWAYAYALPADMGTPIRIVPDLEALGLGLPTPLPGDPYAETWAAADRIELPYIIENGTLYTSVEDATLEYGINSIDEIVLPAKVVLAISTELASRIAVPVKGDRKMRRDLMEEADLHWQRAIADDKNRHPVTTGNYVSEVQMARAGLFG